MTTSSDKTMSKWRQILMEMRQAITSGTYVQGQRLPSEVELVERFGVSRLTVARALRELQFQGLVQRRPGSGTYVQVPGLASGNLLGLLIPDLGQTEIFEPICQGMTQARQSSSFSLLWGTSTLGATSREMQVEELCDHYITKKVAGVFFAPLELTPAKDELNNRIAEKFTQAGIPMILLDRDLEAYPRRSRYDLVGIDNRRAGYTITEHVLKLGCQNIVFVARPSSAPTVDARIAGYREALYSYGAAVGPDNIKRIAPGDTDAVHDVMKNLHPEAFVCANDFTAGVLMRSLGVVGYQVPHDVRLVGIDDVKYARLLPVPLTTIHQPCLELGAAAVGAMIERIAQPTMPARDILLDFQLVVRDSCGAKLERAESAPRDRALPAKLGSII